MLRTLSALSYSEKARRFQVPGFPRKERKLEKRLEEEESLYEELKQLYDRGLPVPDTSPLCSLATQVENRAHFQQSP